MKQSLFYIFFTLLSAKYSIAFAQIVNIERERIQNKDSVGWAGDIGADFNLQKTKQTLTQLGSNVHLQYKTPHNVWLLLGQTQFVQADREAFENNAFVHLRYNRRLNDWLRVELFAQAQNNIINKVRLRALAGTGGRMRIVKSRPLTIYIGVSYLYEYGEELLPTRIDYRREHRNSDYLTVTWRPVETVNCVSTTYYQPLIGAVKDYRLAHESRFSFKVLKHLSLTSTFRYTYDSVPAFAALNSTFAWTNGFAWGF
jgi:hypothetical protein